jgi:hypothetical protein
MWQTEPSLQLVRFFNFHFLNFDPKGQEAMLSRVLMMASPTGKKSKAYLRSKVRGFDGTSKK